MVEDDLIRAGELTSNFIASGAAGESSYKDLKHQREAQTLAMDSLSPSPKCRY
jgi:hypothetical protein